MENTPTDFDLRPAQRQPFLIARFVLVWGFAFFSICRPLWAPWVAEKMFKKFPAPVWIFLRPNKIWRALTAALLRIPLQIGLRLCALWLLKNAPCHISFAHTQGIFPRPCGAPFYFASQLTAALKMEKFAPTPGVLYRDDFAKLGALLRRPEFSVRFAQRLAKDFPELEGDFSAKIAKAVGERPINIETMRLAEDLGVLDPRAGLVFEAAREGKLSAAGWLAERLDPTTLLAEVKESTPDLSGLAIIFRKVKLPKSVKFELFDVAARLIAEAFVRLDHLHYNVSSEDVDARKYPLVREYLEKTDHRLLPGKQLADPVFLAQAEGDLKAAAWIIDTFSNAYPSERIYEEFDIPPVHPNESAILRSLVREYRRSSQK